MMTATVDFLSNKFSDAISFDEIARDLYLIDFGNNSYKFFKGSRNISSGFITFDRKSVKEVAKDVFKIKSLDGKQTIFFSSITMNMTNWLFLQNEIRFSENLFLIEVAEKGFAFIKFPILTQTSWQKLSSHEKLSDTIFLITDTKGRAKSFDSTTFRISGCLSGSDCALLRKKYKKA